MKPPLHHAAEEFMEKVSRPMCRSLATKAN
eukprot:SAG25_NODE_3355_length_1115_cov_2.216535_3_plen_29_part_01